MAMQKIPFNGNLNPNEIFSAVYNMIIGQQIMDTHMANNYTGFMKKFMLDGSLYGDTYLFYTVKPLFSKPWTGDSEAASLLSLDRPTAPKCQAITIDTFRQVRVTVDNYLSKRAWGEAGVFGQFNQLLLRLLGDAKKMHEVTTFNSYVGSAVSGATKATVSIDLTTATTSITGEEKARIRAQTIAKSLADLIVDMKDYTTLYNDDHYIAAYAEGDLGVLWNASYVNEIRKEDLPTIFHNDGLVDKIGEDVLPSKYFGTAIRTSADLAAISASTPTTGKPINSSTGAYTPGSANANGCVRSLVEKDVTVSSTAYHIIPGQEIPSGATVKASSGNFGLGEVYLEDKSIICKVVSKDAFKFMSGFEVGTNFFNSRSLTENHYLTWGYGAPDRIYNEPIVTLKEV